jgi:6-phosphogluconate dehydrogenase
VIVLSLPAGAAVEDTIRDLAPMIATGDTLVDAGNSYYRDSMRRALALSQQGLRYIDTGVSCGVHGLDQGYCLMLGGTPRSIEIFEPFAKILAPDAEHGWLHCGPSGAGHFAKMIHNGIEYGMMQSLAEGFALSRIAPVVPDSGEGRWTVLESIELGVPAPVITLALMDRFSSQGGSDYARKLLAMMRAGFGGHSVQKAP